MAPLNDAEFELLRMFDWTENQKPSITVVLTIADLDDTDPVALPPLETVIESDALNNLLMQSNRSAKRDCAITFTYCGYTLKLTPEGGTIYGGPQQERLRAETQPDRYEGVSD